MILNESVFKDLSEGKERITEKNWKYKIDKDLAFKLRELLEDDDTDYEALREVMKAIYDNIHRLIPDMFDEDECESAKEDLDILDTEEEDGFYDPDDEEYDFVDTLEDSWNYELSNLYDICDTFNIWIPIRSLDEDTDYSESEYNEFGYDSRTGDRFGDWEGEDSEYNEFGIDTRTGKPFSKKVVIESAASSSIRNKVYNAVYDIFTEAQDALAFKVHESVPEYNPDWCIQDGYTAKSVKNFDKFVQDNVDDLLYYADELNENSVYEEVSISEKLHLDGGNQHIDSVGQLVYNEVKKIDPNVEVVTGDHTKVGVFTRNSNQVEQLKEAAIKAMAKHHYKPEVIKFKQLKNNYSGYVFDQISGGQVEVEPLRMREAFVTKDMPGLIKAAKAAGLTTLAELDAFIKEHEGKDIMKALADKNKETITEGNTITNELPESIDQFLMDIAQTTNAFDYNDVSKFAKRATEEDIKKLKNLRRKWLRDAEMMEDDEVEAFGKKVASIVK